MVSLEDLEAFDLQLWLGSGQLAAEALHCHPSSVSRRCKIVTETFQLLNLRRGIYAARTEEWLELLRMQRKLHQQYRLTRRSRLRLETAPGLRVKLPDEWWTPIGRKMKESFCMEEIRLLINDCIVDAAFVRGSLIYRPDLEGWQPMHALKNCLTAKDQPVAFG